LCESSITRNPQPATRNSLFRLIDNYQKTAVNIFTSRDAFPLDCGVTLPAVEIGYCTYGTYRPSENNVVWVFHALTGNADALDWWDGLIGDGLLFDPKHYFIVCANVLGSCYGSTCPSTINPTTGKAYHKNFPLITVRDMVNAHRLLRNHLGIDQIHIGIGGSLGGQQLLEWTVTEPEIFDIIIPIATNAKHSPWGIAFNESQRMALEADDTLYDHHPEAGRKGLAAARSIAMLSYRNYRTYDNSQQDEEAKMEDYRASSYQRYQGLKLVKRFEPLAYLSLSKSMDSQDIGRDRGGIKKALSVISAIPLVIGITSDILYPVNEQELIARYIPNAQLEIIDSDYGHDGFLIEYGQLTYLISQFLIKHKVFRQ